jgi:tetratricopeptide (TPR) repeat protein
MKPHILSLVSLFLAIGGRLAANEAPGQPDVSTGNHPNHEGEAPPAAHAPSLTATAPETAETHPSHAPQNEAPANDTAAAEPHAPTGQPHITSATNHEPSEDLAAPPGAHPAHGNLDALEKSEPELVETHQGPIKGVPAHAKDSGQHRASAKAEGHANAGAEAKAEHGASTEAAGEHGEKLPDEAASLDTEELMNYANSAFEGNRLDAAAIAYRQLLTHKMPKAMQKQVLMGFARTLRKKGDLTKSASVYERLIKDYNLDSEAPEVFLELGRVQRALGAYRSAINRFYSVINSTIKLPEEGANKYRQLAKTAQFEIAETYFMSGDFTEASRFFSRLRLLDLATADRARAHFKAAYSLQLANDHTGALNQFKSFIELYPDDENVPEAYFCMAVSLRKLNRTQEALVAAMDLLKTEKTRTSKDPKRWAYWQRKTGNQLANDFYDQGDFRNALAIYSSLAELSAEPAWRLPVAYQMGLCQERLGMTDKAMQSYKEISETAKKQKADDPRKAEMDDLSRMAQWRLQQIDWTHATERKLDLMARPSEDPAPSKPKT